MRTTLAPLSNQYVLCKGWIEDWEKLSNDETRFYIKNPVIKKPNRNVLFEDQKVIAREGHINLFIKEKDMYSYRSSFKRLDQILFSGTIGKYRRKNGTFDYGVFPTEQSLLHLYMERLSECIYDNPNDKRLYTEKSLKNYEFRYKPILLASKEKLEKSGHELPTFFHTYGEYRAMINGALKVVNESIGFIRYACSNRTNRRFYGIKRDFASSIPTYEEYCEKEGKIEVLDL